MSTEKEFGFIITQGLTRKMTKAKLADKIIGFLADRKNALMKTLKLPENRIHTSCYYDRDMLPALDGIVMVEEVTLPLFRQSGAERSAQGENCGSKIKPADHFPFSQDDLFFCNCRNS